MKGKRWVFDLGCVAPYYKDTREQLAKESAMKRRSFLKQTALSATALALPSNEVFGARKKETDNKSHRHASLHRMAYPITGLTNSMTV